jgi:PAS domain S-box-containing protein
MDPHGELWISTRGGLGAYYEGQFFSFNYTSGLVNPQLWPVLPEDHQVLVGTMGSGVAILNRDEDPQPQPRIHLEKPATEENTAFLRWHSYAYWGQPAPAEILTRYRINSGTWSEWSTRREVSVDGLEPGECSYQVQAKGLFGNFDPEGVSGKFIIALPLYRHPAVIIPTGSLSILVIILGFVIFIRKKKHNQAIIQSEAKFRGVAETTASAIFIYQGSKFQYLNPGTENLTGYTRNELENLSFSDLIKTKHFRSINPPLSMRNLAELIPGRYEFKITTKGSIERWVDLTIGEVEYQGKPARLGTAFDITDRMELGRKIISYRDQLRSLASELSIAEEKERRRLALILHDTIGQTLAFCKIKLGAYRALQNSVSSAESIDEIRNLIDQSIRDTRSLTLELSPQVLHELGLQKALGWLCEQMKEKHSIDFVFYDDRQPKPLTDELQSVVYHAVRELMINIVKHAQVETAQISLRRNGNQVCILVEDRGVGFDASGVFVNRNGNSGFGLFSIRERLSLLGGHLELSSQHSTGTTATLSVPLRSQQGTAGGQSCE